MDFHSVLSMASEKQGLSNSQKRYSLKPGPPKKDPKVKGVNSAAVQAFLKKREIEDKKKELMKKQQKELLLAKRVELKSDRKARAMASRTKDNFRGYNGIPVVDQPKKRGSKFEMTEEQQDLSDGYNYEDNYEYAESDGESEPEPTPVRPQERSVGPSKLNSALKKPSAPPKAALPPMNFADLLKLAEKKQFEPVELKPVKKTEERLRTAEEIKELELERKAKQKPDKQRDFKTEKCSGHKDNKSVTNSHKKNVNDREIREGKSHKSSREKRPSGNSRPPKPHTQTERPHSFTKSSHGHGSRPSSSSSGALSGKVPMMGTSASVKQMVPRPQSGGKPATSSDLSSKKGHHSLPQVKTNSSGGRSEVALNSFRQSGNGQAIKESWQPRPSQNNMVKGRPPPNLGKGGVSRSGGNPTSRPSTNGPTRSAPAGSSKQVGTQQSRPGGSFHSRPVSVEARSSVNGPSKSSRPINSMGQGPGRPQCTVVSETISSKNFAPKAGMPQRPSAPQGPRTIIGPTGHRILARPPGPALPPITSSYKRKYEDEEEYDSEMDDFIDDEGEEQDEVSKHIREIFGYDRTKYKEESDYALRFMESSWKEQQKEEARSLRMAVLEDQEEERREMEEMKRNAAKKRELT